MLSNCHGWIIHVQQGVFICFLFLYALIIFHNRISKTTIIFYFVSSLTMQTLATQQFEAQKVVEEMTEAEKEELEVRKRREEGTPVNDITFAAWKRRFEAEMAELKTREREVAEKEVLAGGKKTKGAIIKREESAFSDRLTGFEQFSGKAGVLAMEALEKEAELEEQLMNLEVDEELFEDEEDLDDLDFDSDASYDESDEELDI
jgi:hypothetical protein